jgi:hypothetical protein
MQAIMSLAPNAIEFSTVYYGEPDHSAAARLRKMAKVGNGEFVDASNAKDIHLDDVIKVPDPKCKH